MMPVKTDRKNFIESPKHGGSISCQNLLCYPEKIIIVENMQVIYDRFVGEFVSAKTYQPVEDGKCIAQCSVCFKSYHVKRIFFCIHSFIRSNQRKMAGNVINCDSSEIINLATRKNSRDDFMLLGCRQNKYRIRWRLFKGFQECIERTSREHVNFVYNIDFIFSAYRGVANLLNEGTDIFNRIIGSGVKLKDIQ